MGTGEGRGFPSRGRRAGGVRPEAGRGEGVWSPSRSPSLARGEPASERQQQRGPHIWFTPGSPFSRARAASR